MASPIQLRNVVRYARDVKASLPLYEALGFQPVRAMDGFAMLRHESGLNLVLHGTLDGGEVPRQPIETTALGFTMLGNDVAASRAHIERAGWRLVRAPSADDEGFFFIYGDLDGNLINLVGERR